MKNVLAGAVAATLLSSGLIATPAVAADVPPSVVAVGIGKPVGQQSLVKAKVVAVSAGDSPEGELHLKVFRVDKTQDELTLVRSRFRTLGADDQGKARFLLTMRKVGTYRFGVEFRGAPGSSMEGVYAIGFGKFRVKKR